MRFLLLILLVATGIMVFIEYRKTGDFWAALNPFDGGAETEDVAVADTGTKPVAKQSTPAPDTNSTAPSTPAVQPTPTETPAAVPDAASEPSAGDVSPHKGKVTLAKGNAIGTDPEQEHLIITAHSTNSGPVTISDWQLESTMTSSEAEIPDGARFLEKRLSRDTAPITLLPGERAYLISGRTPIRVSFRENVCTGYLSEYDDGTYSPALTKSCPKPGDEMLQYGNIKDSDEECFEFVGDIRQCEIVEDEKLNDANLTSSCESFIEDVLDYEGCVVKHKDDATFYSTGDWRIYLGKYGELWKSAHESIRLLDSNGKVVDSIEY